MKVIGIGNAIVDVICKVDDNFLIQNDLTKSTMKLVDEIEFKKLLLNLNIIFKALHYFIKMVFLILPWKLF